MAEKYFNRFHSFCRSLSNLQKKFKNTVTKYYDGSLPSIDDF